MYFNGRPLPGLLISGQDTYQTWEMIPTKRLHVVPPEPKTTYVDLPGANGGIDYTELLTGFPTYGYRKGSWEFLLIPAENWPNVYQNLVETFHGKHHEIILQDDPNYYYTGRLKVNEWQSNAYNSLITIDYVLDPERKSVSGDPPDHDEEDLLHAGRILRKEENAGKIIKLNGTTAVLATPESLFDDGDSVQY